MMQKVGGFRASPSLMPACYHLQKLDGQRMLIVMPHLCFWLRVFGDVATSPRSTRPPGQCAGQWPWQI